MKGDRAKRMVGSIYSAAADRLYEPIVVRGAFRIFGGKLGERIAEQGRDAVALAHGRAILDMPVGTAHFTIETARVHGGVIVGADIAGGMVRKAGAVAREAGVDNLVLVQADVHQLPFRTGTFPAILCTNGLQVMPGLVRTVTELARVLERGGTLFISMLSLGLGSKALPTFLRPGSDVIVALEGAGLVVTATSKERLATLIEARKPT
jgi:SAM-dependent methyltransferase